MLTAQIIDSWESFQSHTQCWNQLWELSQSHVAFHRAEPICNFVEAFELQDSLRVVLVRSGDQLVTAVPMTLRRRSIGGVGSIGRWEAESLANEWFLQACFLDLPVGDPAARMEALNAGFRQLNLSRVKLDWLPLDWPAQRRLMDLWRQRRSVWAKPRFEVHKMHVPKDWEAYYRDVTKSTKKTIQRSKNQLSQKGQIAVEEISLNSINEFEMAFHQALQIEHAGWKGADGSSMSSHPRIADFYRRSFLQLAQQQLARLYFLKVGDQRIAFDLGYTASGVYSSIKVSYLPEFSKFSPGNLLNGLLLERFSQTKEVEWIDCIGPATDSTRRWTDDSYISGRLTISTGSLISNAEVMLLNTAANWLGKNSLPIHS